MKAYQDNLMTGRIECSENTRLWNIHIKKTIVIIDKKIRKSEWKKISRDDLIFGKK